MLYSSDILSNFNSFNCLIICSSAIIKPFNISFSSTGKGIPVCAREPSNPLLNAKLKFFSVILHFCKPPPSVISLLFPPPPSLPKCYLFIQGTPLFLLSFSLWQLWFLYPFLYSSINVSLLLCVYSLMQAITAFLNLICLPTPLKSFSLLPILPLAPLLICWSVLY